MAQDTNDGRSGPGRLHRDEARRLVAACGGKAGDAASIAHAAEQVCRHVVGNLEPLIGRRAAQALLARSVYLSKTRFKTLDVVSTAEPDVAAVERELAARLRAAEPEEALEAAKDVFGNFAWLLTRFISEELGLRLLREACPNLDEDKR